MTLPKSCQTRPSMTFFSNRSLMRGTIAIHVGRCKSGEKLDFLNLFWHKMSNISLTKTAADLRLFFQAGPCRGGTSPTTVWGPGPRVRRNWKFYIEKIVCLPVFSDGQDHWWDISKLFQPHIWHLVSRKLTWKTHPPMERSIFQNSFFYILRPDSDSSRKSSYTNCPHFLNIPIGSWSNLQKTLKNKGKLNLPSKIEFFAYLTNFL